MKNVSLPIAVLSVISTFRSNAQNFSAHDVTKEVRRRLNDGEIDIPDLPLATFNGISSRDISHEQVRGFITELYKNNLLDCFVKDNHSAGAKNFTLYRFGCATVPTASTVNTATLTGSPVSTMVLPTMIPTSNSRKAVVVDPKSLLPKIEDYIKARKKESKVVTLKKIQSRLKGYSVTTKQIADVLTTQGYSLTTDNARPCYSIVK